jgi:hypothetical protein
MDEQEEFDGMLDDIAEQEAEAFLEAMKANGTIKDYSKDDLNKETNFRRKEL